MKKKAYKAPSIKVYGDLFTLTAGSTGTCNDGTSLSDVVIGAPGTVTIPGIGVISGCAPIS